jgi:pSer/pThr/pTyr-binding forkhead associated (FHA) protein
MSFRLYVQEKDSELRVLDLEGPVVSIGRAEDNDVVISDARSSRRHCRLSETPQGVVLEDLKSANGTLLKGKAVAQSLLGRGDEFVVGSTHFHFEEMKEESAASARGRPQGAFAGGERAPGAAAVETSAVAVKAAPEAPTLVVAEDEGHLEILEGEHAEPRVSLSKLPFTIGRSRRNDLALQDGKISSEHARIVREGAQLVVEDLGSKNGVQVNGRRVERAVLSPGSRLKIGNFTFRVHVRGPALQPAGRAALGAAAPAGETSATAVDGSGQGFTINVATEQARATERVEQWVAIAAALLILSLAGYFSVDVAQRLWAERETDPKPEGNWVGDNWSFEAAPVAAVPGAGSEGSPSAATPSSVPGWTLQDAGSGRIERSTEGAQPPGLWALKLAASGEGLCSAVHDAPVSLVAAGDAAEGQRLVLEGFVANRGAFFSALAVEWLRVGGSGLEVVGRSFGEAARGPESSLEAYRVLAPPSFATHARVACCQYGSGYSLFDRVSLSAAAQPRVDGPRPEAEGGDERRVFRAGSDADAIAVSLQEDGDFSLRRVGRRLLPSFWAAFGPERDPMLLGPRLAKTRTRSGDGGKVVVASAVLDVLGETWAAVTATVSVEGNALGLRWKLEGESEAKSEEPAEKAVRTLSLYFESYDAKLPLVLHGAASSNETVFAQASRDEVVEIVVGAEGERAVIEFSAPVRVAAQVHPLGADRWLLVATPVDGGAQIGVVCAPASRRQQLIARMEIKEAEQLFQSGKVAAAFAKLNAVVGEGAQNAGESRRAAEILDAWREEAVRVVAELNASLEELRQSPSAVVFESYVSRGKTWVERYRGTPAGNEIAAALARLEAEWKQSHERVELARSREVLDQARQHFEARRFGLAEACLRGLVVEGSERAAILVSPETLREARELLGRIEGRQRAAAEALLRQ